MTVRRILLTALFAVAVAGATAFASSSAWSARAERQPSIGPGGSAAIAGLAQARPRSTPASPQTTLPFPRSNVGTRNQNGQTVRVDPRRAWTPTGITVRRGDHLAFQASGQVRPTMQGSGVGPQGGSATSPNFPVPSAGVGMLIGRIGDGQAFAIGERADDIAMPADGQLFLGVNDDVVADNVGQFVVNVARSATALGTSGRVGDTLGDESEAFTVSAAQPWTSTGLAVRAGDRLTFRARGQVTWGDGPRDVARAAGGSIDPNRQPHYPVATLGVGGLIGRVGDGQPFAIGATSGPIVMPASGELFLGINDDFFNDNRGTFTVVVQRAEH